MIVIETNMSTIQRLDRSGIHLGLFGTLIYGEMSAESTTKGDGTFILLIGGDDVPLVNVATEEVVECADFVFVGGGVETDDA